jgi:hypothetical protein
LKAQHSPIDKHGRVVRVGARVRLLLVSETLLRDLPKDEVADLRSMVGEIFEVVEIDEYGKPWIGKGWSSSEGGQYRGHSIALDSDEMELVDG